MEYFMADDKKKQKDGKVKVPQIDFTKISVKQQIILGAGLILLIAGIVLLAGIISSNMMERPMHFAWGPLVLFAGGTVLLFLTLVRIQNSICIFLSIWALLSGVLLLCTNTGIMNLTLKELWPLIVVFGGISLVPASFYKYKRVSSVFIIPGVILICLGVFFLMFSLHFIKISLARFICLWWPVLIIALGIFLVVVFFVQQKNSKKFPYMVDDSRVEI